MRPISVFAECVALRSNPGDPWRTSTGPPIGVSTGRGTRFTFEDSELSCAVAAGRRGGRITARKQTGTADHRVLDAGLESAGSKSAQYRSVHPARARFA